MASAPAVRQLGRGVAALTLVGFFCCFGLHLLIAGDGLFGLATPSAGWGAVPAAEVHLRARFPRVGRRGAKGGQVPAGPVWGTLAAPGAALPALQAFMLAPLGVVLAMMLSQAWADCRRAAEANESFAVARSLPYDVGYISRLSLKRLWSLRAQLTQVARAFRQAVMDAHGGPEGSARGGVPGSKDFGKVPVASLRQLERHEVLLRSSEPREAQAAAAAKAGKKGRKKGKTRTKAGNGKAKANKGGQETAAAAAAVREKAPAGDLSTAYLRRAFETAAADSPNGNATLSLKELRKLLQRELGVVSIDSRLVAEAVTARANQPTAPPKTAAADKGGGGGAGGAEEASIGRGAGTASSGLGGGVASEGTRADTWGVSIGLAGRGPRSSASWEETTTRSLGLSSLATEEAGTSSTGRRRRRAEMAMLEADFLLTLEVARRLLQIQMGPLLREARVAFDARTQWGREAVEAEELLLALHRLRPAGHLPKEAVEAVLAEEHAGYAGFCRALVLLVGPLPVELVEEEVKKPKGPGEPYSHLWNRLLLEYVAWFGRPGDFLSVRPRPHSRYRALQARAPTAKTAEELRLPVWRREQQQRLQQQREDRRRPESDREKVRGWVNRELREVETALSQGAGRVHQEFLLPAALAREERLEKECEVAEREIPRLQEQIFRVREETTLVEQGNLDERGRRIGHWGLAASGSADVTSSLQEVVAMLEEETRALKLWQAGASSSWPAAAAVPAQAGSGLFGAVDPGRPGGGVGGGQPAGDSPPPPGAALPGAAAWQRPWQRPRPRRDRRSSVPAPAGAFAEWGPHGILPGERELPLNEVGLRKATVAAGVYRNVEELMRFVERVVGDMGSEVHDREGLEAFCWAMLDKEASMTYYELRDLLPRVAAGVWAGVRLEHDSALRRSKRPERSSAASRQMRRLGSQGGPTAAEQAEALEALLRSPWDEA